MVGVAQNIRAGMNSLDGSARGNSGKWHKNAQQALHKTPPTRYNSGRRMGGIAQLGERLHGMQEVSGSIPLTSTNSSAIQFLELRSLPPVANKRDRHRNRSDATVALSFYASRL
jgi:hypothetical protein